MNEFMKRNVEALHRMNGLIDLFNDVKITASVQWFAGFLEQSARLYGSRSSIEKVEYFEKEFHEKFPELKDRVEFISSVKAECAGELLETFIKICMDRYSEMNKQKEDKT